MANFTPTKEKTKELKKVTPINKSNFCNGLNSLKIVLFTDIVYFWKKIVLAKIGNIEIGDFPLLLAPMEDVSDPPFRALCKKYGADVMYTEFISSEGLIRDAAKSVQKLDLYE